MYLIICALGEKTGLKTVVQTNRWLTKINHWLERNNHRTELVIMNFTSDFWDLGLIKMKTGGFI